MQGFLDKYSPARKSLKEENEQLKKELELIEITYKATSHAYDNFKGPLAVLDYIGNSTNPAVYKLPARILNDCWKLATGDKTMGGFLMGLQAFPRAFQDSYRMYIRDNK